MTRGRRNSSVILGLDVVFNLSKRCCIGKLWFKVPYCMGMLGFKVHNCMKNVRFDVWDSIRNVRFEALSGERVWLGSEVEVGEHREEA